MAKNGIVLLSCLFFLFRLCLNWKSPDLISTPDELYQGYIATEWLNGLRTNLFHYQGDPYTAGSLVVGTFAAPFFALLGKSVFSLKCVPVLFSFGAFLGIIHLLKRQFGGSAALAVGLLILFSPPGYTALFMMALGSHPESIFPAMGLLGCLFLYIRNPSGRSAFLFGVSGGLACWFALINIPADLLCAVLFLYFIFKKRLPFSHLTFKILGAMTGFLPWFFYNVTHQWRGFEFLSLCLQNASAEGAAEALRHLPGSAMMLLGVHFPASLFLKQASAAFLYTAFLLLGYAGFIFSGFFKKKETGIEERVFFYFFVFFPLIFLTFFSYFQNTLSWHHEMTPFRFRYFAPFFYFLTIPCALWTFSKRKFRFVYYFLLFCGIWGQIQLFIPPATLPGMKRPGYFLENPRRVYDLARGQEEPKFQFPNWQTFPSFAAAKESLKKEPVSFQPVYEMELGASLFNWNSVTARPDAVFSDFDLKDPELSAWILRGIGHSLLWTVESPAMLEKALQNLQASPSSLNGIYWGIGWKLKEYGGNPDLISKYPDEISKPMKEGFESYLPRK